VRNSRGLRQSQHSQSSPQYESPYALPPRQGDGSRNTRAQGNEAARTQSCWPPARGTVEVSISLKIDSRPATGTKPESWKSPRETAHRQ